MNFILSLFISLSSFYAVAQVTLIRDVNFEKALVDQGIDTDNAVNGEMATADAKNIKKLDVAGYQINDLTGIEAFVDLTGLFVENNQLTQLNLAYNPKLYFLGINGNSISSITLSSIKTTISIAGVDTQKDQLQFNGPSSIVTLGVDTTDLQDFGLLEKKLDRLLLVGSQDNILAFMNDVYVDIPDPAFEKYLADNGLDKDGEINGRIAMKELAALKYLTIKANLNISDLTGIEGFVNLVELAIEENNLTSLDLSKLTALEALVVTKNKLKKVDISNNPNLNWLDLSQNELTQIDITKNPNLVTLNLSKNNLSVIDISQNTVLEKLSIAFNNLTAIEMGNNKKLTNVSLTANKLEVINVSNNLALKGLYVGDNDIKGTIDISNLVGLKELYAYNNSQLKCIKRSPENIDLLIETKNNKDYSCN